MAIWRRILIVCGVYVREWQEESASARRFSTCFEVFGLGFGRGLGLESDRGRCVCPSIDLVFGACLRLCLSSGRAACLSNDPSCLQICPFVCCPLIYRAVCLSNGLDDALLIHAVFLASLLEVSCTVLVTHLAHDCLFSQQKGYLLVCAALTDLRAVLPEIYFLAGAVWEVRVPCLGAQTLCLELCLLPRAVLWGPLL